MAVKSLNQRGHLGGGQGLHGDPEHAVGSPGAGMFPLSISLTLAALSLPPPSLSPLPPSLLPALSFSLPPSLLGAAVGPPGASTGVPCS